MLDRITPIVLTYNEAPNIAATLERLAWAKDVVVVDSHSTDQTLAIARRFPNVRVFQRAFDDLARQWTFALGETGIATEWVMRLDADYRVSPALAAEMAALEPPADVVGYSVPFRYCIHGRPLRGTLYPRSVRLFRRDRGTFRQDGHTEGLVIAGRIVPLSGSIDHDDHKPVERFFQSQIRYMREEADKLAGTDHKLDFADRLRRIKFIGPLAVLLYCLFGKGLILDGRAGIFYSLQRSLAETMLSIYLLDRELRDPGE